MPQVDFLVSGSGIAGLSYATKLARHFEAHSEVVSIAVITKVQADETATKYAQGGIAAVWSKDDSFPRSSVTREHGVCPAVTTRTSLIRTLRRTVANPTDQEQKSFFSVTKGSFSMQTRIFSGT